MVDSSGAVYPVDRIAYRKAVYSMREEECYFVADTNRRTDSATAVAIMRKHVVVAKDFLRSYLIPLGGIEYLPRMLQVEIVKTRAEIITAIQKNKKTFYK